MPHQDATEQAIQDYNNNNNTGDNQCNQSAIKTDTETITNLKIGVINNNVKKNENENDSNYQKETVIPDNTQKSDVDDYSAHLLPDGRESSVYNECTVPKYTGHKKPSVFSKKSSQLSACLPLRLSTDRHQQANTNNNSEILNGHSTASSDTAFVKVNLDDQQDDEAACIDDYGDDSVRFTNKTSVHGDMMQSVNSLRLNVNNHIIGRMRKLSINELNKRGNSARNAKYCRIAFYAAIISLSLLFLFLIYQNLFNDG